VRTKEKFTELYRKKYTKCVCQSSWLQSEREREREMWGGS
jgi:methyl coenzyme M reductase alpha subunit